MTMNQKILLSLMETSGKYGKTAVASSKNSGLDKRTVTYLKKIQEEVSEADWKIVVKCINDDNTFILSSGGKTKSIQTLLNSIRKGDSIIDRHVSSKCVYIIKSDIYYKIGVSSSLMSRIGIMQAGNPIKLEVINTYYFSSDADAYKAESKIHEAYSYKHVSGEWFLLNHEDISNINSELGSL